MRYDLQGYRTKLPEGRGGHGAMGYALARVGAVRAVSGQLWLLWGKWEGTALLIA